MNDTSKNKTVQDNRPSFVKDALSFIPMGGSGEFGCNMNVYHCDGKFLIVDCGIGFPDERLPGLDVLLPDPGFLRDCKKDIVGLVLTHAHDDHKGAISALWPQLECPIFATPFVMDLLKFQLQEWDLARRVSMQTVPTQGTLNLGPFDLEFINTAHSVVESSMLVIKTPHGNVLHTGDWRIDDTPMEGAATDIARLQALKDENILAIVGDSTNATVSDRHPSEKELIEPMADIFREAPGRVVVTTFSHSVPRMRTAVEAAKNTNREIGMIGRSMLKVQDVARKHGYLNDVKPFLTDKQLSEKPAKNVVIFATGSQGEPGSAMDRLAADSHPTVTLEPDDLVIFSAREIPGNEKTIERIRNRLLRCGVRVIMPEDKFVHASGHAYASEMRELFDWVKPVSIIPVHGNDEAQFACAHLASEAGIKHAFIPENGDVVVIRPTGVEKTGQVISDTMAVDGVRIVPVKDSQSVKERLRVASEGSIVVTVVADDEGFLLHDPIFTIAGLGVDDEDNYELEEMLLNDIDEVVGKLDTGSRQNPELLRETIRLAVRRRIKQEFGKRPLLNVHLVQLS